MISIRNVQCDFYLDQLNGFNRPAFLQQHRDRSPKSRVPVIRIFGPLENGAKCCLHIHGAFPYILLRIGAVEVNDGILDELKTSINAVILDGLSASRKTMSDYQVTSAILDIQPMKAKSIYGYYKDQEHFVKVSFNSPYIAKIVIEAFHLNATKNPLFQPYAAHIPFILQFFIDNAIFGMDLVHVERVKFRISEKASRNEIYFGNYTVQQIIDEVNLLSPVAPQTNMAVECDCFVTDILNAYSLETDSESSNPGLNYIWKDEARRCAERGVAVPAETSQDIGRPPVVTNYERESLQRLRDVLKKLSKSRTARNLLEAGQIASLTQDVAATLNETLQLRVSADCEDVSFLVSDDQAVEEALEEMPQTVEETEEDANEHVHMTQRMSMFMGDDDQPRGAVISMGTDSSLRKAVPEALEPEFVDHTDDERMSNISSFGIENDDMEMDSGWDLAEDEGVISDIEDLAPPENQIIKEHRMRKRTKLPGIEGHNIAQFLNDSRPPTIRMPSPTPSPVSGSLDFLQLNSPNSDEMNGSALLQLTPTRFEERLINHTIVLPKEPDINTEQEHSDIQHLCVLSLELMVVPGPGKMMPDPKCDAIYGIFYSVQRNVCVNPKTDETFGFICIDNAGEQLKPIPNYRNIPCLRSEMELLEEIVKVVLKYDPDMVIGFDTERLSWGYLMERAQVLGFDLLTQTSRFPPGEYLRTRNPSGGDDHLGTVGPRGRLLLNVWRVMRAEVPLRSYEFSTVVHHVLGRRFPTFPASLLREWMTDGKRLHFVVENFAKRAEITAEMMYQLDIYTKTAEMARVYGIQFEEVLSRGSQFRVESILFRLAHLHGIVAVSPSEKQRDQMASPETIPLTMEPEAGIYRDPVIVLDFQSLYPSISMAYNYCFTTCLGRIGNMISTDGTAENMILGALHYNLPIDLVMSLLNNDQLHVSPTGAVFVKANVWRGLIPIMLDEILKTRFMVKKSMKAYKDNPRLVRILDARQMALKLVANVTYGYTAANFTGRMPCVEVADSIVSKGREALEKAIEMVHRGDYGGARVIYGDTDSMFVLVRGASKEEALALGARIADDVTAANPFPMKLKFEKVYLPAVLETKKRYVGMAYETVDDEGTFDAKGIETVRRDGCPLVSRMLEKTLRLLFIGNEEAMLDYIDDQLLNLEKLPISEFIFAKEYRGRYADSAAVPAKKIADKRLLRDSRSVPLKGERVPYVLVENEDDDRVIACVREPGELLADSSLRLNFAYYVNRHVLPALHRVLALDNMEIIWKRARRHDCFGCGALGRKPWCENCRQSTGTYAKAQFALARDERIAHRLRKSCAECIGKRGGWGIRCVNMQCTVTQEKILLKRSEARKALKGHDFYDGDHFDWYYDGNKG